MSIVIIGAGPTGLGAAWRLHELGFKHWRLVEAGDQAGGLASSFVDDKGFTWDIGGHVQFSHYAYFDRVMDTLLPPSEWLRHDRESWVWMRDTFIPYPLQYNIRRLPKDDLLKCVLGLMRSDGSAPPANFRDWILSRFGSGLAETFMLPYNLKVWAHPPEMLSSTWVGDRVAQVDLERVISNIILERDDVSWGPNNRFRFPRKGGTGAIWKTCAMLLPSGKIHFQQEVAQIDLAARKLRLAGGEVIPYTHLISTMPLDRLAALSGRGDWLPAPEDSLLRSSSNIVGIGLKGAPPAHLATKSWMYFPEADCPFYRVTVFSNYSPENVPRGGHWSLMCETSESAWKPVDQATVVKETIDGLRNTGLISTTDEIVSTWHYRAPHGYPVPGLERDTVLERLLPAFEELGVFSRGRFGGWKYEVSNQDHSFMQGVEAVDRILNGDPERTLWHPALVNGS